jgi:hypothetical protein
MLWKQAFIRCGSILGLAVGLYGVGPTRWSALKVNPARTAPAVAQPEATVGLPEVAERRDDAARLTRVALRDPRHLPGQLEGSGLRLTPQGRRQAIQPVDANSARAYHLVAAGEVQRRGN